MRRFILLIFLFLFALPAFATAPAYLTGLRIQPSKNVSRFIFILNKKTYGRIKSLPNSNQLSLDFEKTTMYFNMKTIGLRDANVSHIEAKAKKNGSLSFIFTLRKDVKWDVSFMPLDKKNGARLQLVLTTSNPPKKMLVQNTHNPFSKQLQETFKRDVLNAFTNMDVSNKYGTQINPKKQLVATTTDPPLLLQNSIKPTLFTVVIDPGHGGRDPGALGARGVAEKEVVMQISKLLATEINRDASMHAILTRQGDYFVPLRERIQLARKDSADLFIAIHADAYFDKNATGASVYALSKRGATSEAARWLAKRENYSELGDVELNHLQDRSLMLRSVLIDLAQTVTIRDSLRLGNKLLDALDDISSLHHAHVEQAPFVVLKSPDIPSILIEVGFISNPREEKRLANQSYQQKIAKAIYQGIKQYKTIVKN